MHTFPHIESRVDAQERRQLVLDARVEELSADVTASYKHLSEHLGRIEKDLAKMATKEELTKMTTKIKEDLAKMATKEDLAKIEGRFSKIEGRFGKVEDRFGKIEDRIDKIEATMATKEELARIEAAMATKEDLASLENRMLDAFKQLLAVIDARLPAA
jgi:hypothetical protein